MRKPNVLQITGSFFLLSLLALFSVDLVSAVGADDCSSGASKNCYPWGAEGPVAGVWSYESKRNYLVRGFSQMAVLIGIGLFLLVRAGGEQGLSRMEKLAMAAAAAVWLFLCFV
jgi:hypothetical protein